MVWPGPLDVKAELLKIHQDQKYYTSSDITVWISGLDLLLGKQSMHAFLYGKFSVFLIFAAYEQFSDFNKISYTAKIPLCNMHFVCTKQISVFSTHR